MSHEGEHPSTERLDDLDLSPDEMAEAMFDLAYLDFLNGRLPQEINRPYYDAIERTAVERVHDTLMDLEEAYDETVSRVTDFDKKLKPQLAIFKHEFRKKVRERLLTTEREYGGRAIEALKMNLGEHKGASVLMSLEQGKKIYNERWGKIRHHLLRTLSTWNEEVATFPIADIKNVLEKFGTAQPGIASATERMQREVSELEAALASLSTQIGELLAAVTTRNERQEEHQSKYAANPDFIKKLLEHFEEVKEKVAAFERTYNVVKREYKKTATGRQALSELKLSDGSSFTDVCTKLKQGKREVSKALKPQISPLKKLARFRSYAQTADLARVGRRHYDAEITLQLKATADDYQAFRATTARLKQSAFKKSLMGKTGREALATLEQEEVWQKMPSEAVEILEELLEEVADEPYGIKTHRNLLLFLDEFTKRYLQFNTALYELDLKNHWHANKSQLLAQAASESVH